MKLVNSKPKYKCDFCKAKKIERAMIRHERICYFNPSRVCETCDGEGVEFIHALGPDLGVIFEADEKDCTSCFQANIRGGKSYIKKEGEVV